MNDNQPVYFGGCLTGQPSESTKLVLVGVCDDSKSTFLRGSADAPPVIRSAYDGRCFNATTETGIDLSESVLDAGDLLPLANWGESATEYRTVVSKILAAGRVPFLAGGDHAITIPVLEALSVLDEPIHVVQIDAHPDLYPEYEGDRYSHACVAARALEMEHIATLTCIGVRTVNTTQRIEAGKHLGRYLQVSARKCSQGIPPLTHLKDGALVYLTLDLDALDPAFAPGVAHPVPGGLNPRQVLDFLDNDSWRLVGMDAVEVNPSRDEHNRTAILAARCLHEGMGLATRTA